ncbi:MAG: signal peptidase I [Aeromonadaceae bacterium]|jgi:signal peptidase I, bacterial type|nr:signal peptidase I [Aeromonadaceae bacterium]
MANTFSLLLIGATLLTGLVWLLDRFVLLPWRQRRVLKAESATGKALDAGTIETLMREPGWVEQCKGVFPVIAAVLVLRSFLFEPFQIPSGSMMPTLLVGDFILVQKFAYGVKEPLNNSTLLETGHPKRGDVVVFKYPEEPTVDYIKRVVGLPGDRIIYRNKQLFIQPACAGSQDCPAIAKVEQTFLSSGDFIQGGVPLERYQEQLGNVSHRILKNPQQPDYVPMYFHQPGNEADEWVVPEGHYFAMGDNRDNSKDSRFWGFVPERNLVGKAVFIWISFEFERDPGSPIPGWIPTGVRFNRIGGIQ